MCWLHFYVGSFSNTSHACFIFLWGVSLIRPMLAFFFFFFFLLFFYLTSFSHTYHTGIIFYLGSFPYTSQLASFLCGEFVLQSHVCFIFLWGVFFLSREFPLHIPCWLPFYLENFSYTSRADFIFIWGVSLTYPMLAFFFFGEFLLHISFWILFF